MMWHVAQAGVTEGVDMAETASWRVAPDEYVEFVTSGSSAKGEFHCAECGYGVTVHRELPRCPMCGGCTWEPVAWSPFTRALGAPPDAP
jgi:rubrerythrin